jgi:hypothetical protein
MVLEERAPAEAPNALTVPRASVVPCAVLAARILAMAFTRCLCLGVCTLARHDGGVHAHMHMKLGTRSITGHGHVADSAAFACYQIWLYTNTFHACFVCTHVCMCAVMHAIEKYEQALTHMRQGPRLHYLRGSGSGAAAGSVTPTKDKDKATKDKQPPAPGSAAQPRPAKRCARACMHGTQADRREVCLYAPMPI